MIWWSFVVPSTNYYESRVVTRQLRMYQVYKTEDQRTVGLANVISQLFTVIMRTRYYL